MMFRIMVSSLRFLLDYENIEDEDDSDASDNDDDEDSKPENHVVINREAVYKVNNIIREFLISNYEEEPY